MQNELLKLLFIYLNNSVLIPPIKDHCKNNLEDLIFKKEKPISSFIYYIDYVKKKLFLIYRTCIIKVKYDYYNLFGLN